jgi:hypothetical protein
MAAGKKTGGRSRGTPNKITGDVREMILAALDQAGGVNYLLAQSKDNPSAFMTLVGKVLPLNVGGSLGVTVDWPLPKPPLES